MVNDLLLEMGMDIEISKIPRPPHLKNSTADARRNNVRLKRKCPT